MMPMRAAEIDEQAGAALPPTAAGREAQLDIIAIAAEDVLALCEACQCIADRMTAEESAGDAA